MHGNVSVALFLALLTATHDIQSGLTEECRSSTFTKDFVYGEVLKYIKKHVPRRWIAVIGGSSIHFDRTILLREMPEVTNWLKYQ